MAINEESIFETLNAVDVSEHTERKGNLSYLSWAWAWAEVKKRYPAAQYTIYENKDGLNYHTDGRTCWVKTGVKIGTQEYIEYLPVMDYKNQSIPLDKVKSTDINKTIQRSLTKAIARHGLGLYIYAGEDLPESGKPEEKPLNQMSNEEFAEVVNSEPTKDEVYKCADCGKTIVGTSTLSAQEIAEGTKQSYGRVLCQKCGIAEKRARAGAKNNAG